MGKNFDCYTCGANPDTVCQTEWDKDSSILAQCSDDNGNHCFMIQQNDRKGNKSYKRGCQTDETYADFRNGCIDKSDGSRVCYEGCTKSKCNGKENIGSSAMSSKQFGLVFLAIILMLT